MKDYVVRATAAHGNIRAFAARTTDIVSHAQQIHQLFPVASAAIGRVMTAAAMMSADTKGNQDTLSIIVKGSGDLGSVVAVARSGGKLKSYVDHPFVDLPLNEIGKLDVGSAVGKEGKLTIIKDMGLKEPYIGQVELVSGEIGEDIATYYWASEQQPSVVALGTLVNPDLSIQAAGGYIIQPLPGADAHIIEAIEKKLLETPPISALIEKGYSPEEILEIILGDFHIKINDRLELQFECDCSRERLEGVVISLGASEIQDIIHKDGQAELVCHYCNKKYLFDRNELSDLLKRSKA